MFELGPISVHWYGLLMALAFLCGYIIIGKLIKERKLHVDPDEYLIYMIIGLLGGARLGEVLFYNLGYYLANPIKIFAIWEGGIASHGAVLGGIFAHWLFSRKHKLHFYELADLVVIPIALGAVFVRVGNFINAEIIGRPSTLPWSVKYSNWELTRHPSQFYEAFKNLIIFGILWNMRKMKLPKGFLFWSFLLLFSVFRFVVEFFKEYQTLHAPGLTMGQWLSVPLFLVSFWFLWKLGKKSSV